MFQNKKLQYYVKPSLKLQVFRYFSWKTSEILHMEMIIFVFNFLLICVGSLTVRLPWRGWHLNLLSDSICFLGFNLL